MYFLNGPFLNFPRGWETQGKGRKSPKLAWGPSIKKSPHGPDWRTRKLWGVWSKSQLVSNRQYAFIVSAHPMHMSSVWNLVQDEWLVQLGRESSYGAAGETWIPDPSTEVRQPEASLKWIMFVEGHKNQFSYFVSYVTRIQGNITKPLKIRQTWKDLQTTAKKIKGTL